MCLRKVASCGVSVLALSLITLPVHAQVTPSPTPPAVPAQDNAIIGWSDVAEVIVRARVFGPAMWKLTRGSSTVWVLGILAEAPDDLEWNDNRIKHDLQGARELIIPGGSTSSSQAQDQWARGSSLKHGFQLKDFVSVPTYNRFVRTVEREQDVPLDSYVNDTPVRAGKDLFEDVLDAHHISRYAAIDHVRQLAAFARTPVKIAYTIDGDLLSRQWLALDKAGGEACLNAFLDGIDYNLKVVPGMARAWARGELPTVLSDYKETALLTCDLSTPGWRETYKTYFIDDMTASIKDALATPGKAVAVVPLSDLLRKDGVLDQLRAEGIEISSPKS